MRFYCALQRRLTYRLYRKQGLMVRKRKRKQISLAERLVLPVAQAPNESLSMDYVADTLIDGRSSGAHDRR